MKAYLAFDTGKLDWQEAMEFLKYHGHEIEIPEGLEGISLTGWGLDCKQCKKQVPCLANIPIPRPKKRVKKWRWVIATKKGKDVGTTTHMTESELHRIYPNQKWYHRIDETEIEVEE